MAGHAAVGSLRSWRRRWGSSEASGAAAATGEQLGHVAFEAVEVEARAAVADVAVRPNQVLCAVPGAEPSQGGSARVAERPRGGLAAEPVHRDQAPVTRLEPCQALLIPGVRGAAQQQLERWRGEGLMQAAGDVVSAQRGVGEAMPGAGAPTQPRESFDRGRAARVENQELADDAEGKGPQRGMVERQGDGKWRQRRPSQPDREAVRAVSVQKARWVRASTARATGRRSAP